MVCSTDATLVHKLMQGIVLLGLVATRCLEFTKSGSQYHPEKVGALCAVSSPLSAHLMHSIMLPNIFERFTVSLSLSFLARKHYFPMPDAAP